MGFCSREGAILPSSPYHGAGFLLQDKSKLVCPGIWQVCALTILVPCSSPGSHQDKQIRKSKPAFAFCSLFM